MIITYCTIIIIITFNVIWIIIWKGHFIAIVIRAITIPFHNFSHLLCDDKVSIQFPLNIFFIPFLAGSTFYFALSTFISSCFLFTILDVFVKYIKGTLFSNLSFTNIFCNLQMRHNSFWGDIELLKMCDCKPATTVASLKIVLFSTHCRAVNCQTVTVKDLTQHAFYFSA